MKFFSFFVAVIVAVMLMFGAVDARPKVNGNAIRKGGRVIKKGLGVLGAAGTAHEIYNQVRNRHNQG